MFPRVQTLMGDRKVDLRLTLGGHGGEPRPVYLMEASHNFIQKFLWGDLRGDLWGDLWGDLKVTIG